MTTDEPEEVLLECEICLREIPLSEEVSDEARDYVLHYFGSDCYEQWHNQQQKDG